MCHAGNEKGENGNKRKNRKLSKPLEENETYNWEYLKQKSPIKQKCKKK